MRLAEAACQRTSVTIVLPAVTYRDDVSKMLEKCEECMLAQDSWANLTTLHSCTELHSSPIRNATLVIRKLLLQS